jgi:type VI protein secretion system component VasK
MQLSGAQPGSEGDALRRWIFTSLAIISAAITTWALHVTQETWRPPSAAEQQSQIEVEPPDPEIEALEAELVRIQRRLGELRSSTRP